MPAKTSSVNGDADSIQEKMLVAWSAPSRPFVKRSRDFFVMLISVATLFGVILFLIDGIMPVLLIIAIVFLIYVLGTVEPQHIDYQITTWGVKTSGMLHRWEQLGGFWFVEKPSAELVVIEKYAFPGRVEMVLDKDKRADIEKILEKYLIHREASSSNFDKASNWVARKLQW